MVSLRPEVSTEVRLHSPTLVEEHPARISGVPINQLRRRVFMSRWRATFLRKRDRKSLVDELTRTLVAVAAASHSGDSLRAVNPKRWASQHDGDES